LTRKYFIFQTLCIQNYNISIQAAVTTNNRRYRGYRPFRAIQHDYGTKIIMIIIIICYNAYVYAYYLDARESIGLKIKIHYPDDRNRVIIMIRSIIIVKVIRYYYGVNELHFIIRISDGNTQLRVSETNDDGYRSPHTFHHNHPPRPSRVPNLTS